MNARIAVRPQDDSILDLYFTNLKIAATKASSISNVFLPAREQQEGKLP
jgi:hypothetical protein